MKDQTEAVEVDIEEMNQEKIEEGREGKKRSAGVIEEEHIVKMWTPIPFRISEKYKFFPGSLLFKAAGGLLKTAVVILITFLGRAVWGLKIEGRKNFRKMKGGMVTVCNHVHMLDCVFLASALRERHICFPTLQSNFQIPVIRHIIRLLGAVPILESKKGFKKTMEQLEGHLKKGGIVHLYPETVLHPYCRELRGFHRGAFVMAYDCDVPILPMVVSFRMPGRIARIYRRKPYVTLRILEPVAPDTGANKRAETERLKNEVHARMRAAL